MTEIISFNDAIDAAIKKEQDAVEFYRKAKDIVKYPGSLDMLESFVEEEKRHVTLLSEAKGSRDFSSVGSKSLPPEPAFNFSKSSICSLTVSFFAIDPCPLQALHLVSEQN